MRPVLNISGLFIYDFLFFCLSLLIELIHSFWLSFRLKLLDFWKSMRTLQKLCLKKLGLITVSAYCQ